MKTKHKHWAVLAASTLGLTGLASAAKLGSEKYTYDGSGNIVEKSIDGQITKMSYDKENRLISQGTPSQVHIVFEYDASGKVSKEIQNGSKDREYRYGWFGKIIEISNKSEKTHFYYNAEGMYVGKNKDELVEAWAWDGYGLVMRDSVVFSNEGHISGGVPVISSSDNSEIPEIVDYLGTSFDSEYSFGQGVNQATKRFTGKPYDEDLEGMVFPYRVLRPELCRWMEPDPLGYPDGSNTYVYASCLTSSLDSTGLLDMGTKTFIDYGVFTQEGTGISWDMKLWTAKTDDGNYTIDLIENDEKAAHPEYTYNCHGYVFANSNYWINDTDVQDILTGDGWKHVLESDVLAAEGPYIGVYGPYTAPTNEHSVKASEVVDGDVIKVTGKNGVNPNLVTKTPEMSWPAGLTVPGLPPQYYEQ